MFTTAILAVLAGSAVAAPIAQRGQPSSWATGYLEDYDVYHTRYLALDCQDQHDTTFFDDCCHPLLATESLASDRKAYCTPSSSASVATTASDDDASAVFATATESVESVVESILATSTEEAAASATSSLAINADYAKGGYHHKSSSTTAWTEAATTTSSTEDAWTPAASSTEEAAPAPTTTASGGDVQTGGFATFFYQGGNAGECGTVHSDSDYVIAIDSNGWWPDYQSNDNSPYCGKSIVITNTNNGKSVTAVVADVCPTCDTNNSLDLSYAAFTAIASESDGQVPITWVWA